MDAATAADIINNMASPPGYRFAAHTVGVGGATFLHCDMFANAHETNPENAPEYRAYRFVKEGPTPIRQHMAYALEMAGWTGPGDVFAWLLLTFVIPCEAHEWRESMRFQNAAGNWEAPLHPHRLMPSAKWRERVTAHGRVDLYE